MSISLQELLETAEEYAIYHAVLKDTNNLQAKEWYITMHNGELCTVYSLDVLDYCKHVLDISTNIKWLIGSPVQLDLDHIFAEYTIYKEEN